MAGTKASGGRNRTTKAKAKPRTLTRWPWDEDPALKMTREEIHKIISEAYRRDEGADPSDPVVRHLLQEQASLFHSRTIAQRIIDRAEAAGLEANAEALDFGGQNAHVALRVVNARLYQAVKQTRTAIKGQTERAQQAVIDEADDKPRFKVVK